MKLRKVGPRLSLQNLLWNNFAGKVTDSLAVRAVDVRYGGLRSIRSDPDDGPKQWLDPDHYQDHCIGYLFFSYLGGQKADLQSRQQKVDREPLFRSGRTIIWFH
ncbi:MAG: hypothetical protein HYR55_04940 [Acidobacteria bacterium]|nr:hypothetical protein [Acidobacteriota bacterium]